MNRKQHRGSQAASSSGLNLPAYKPRATRSTGNSTVYSACDPIRIRVHRARSDTGEPDGI